MHHPLRAAALSILLACGWANTAAGASDDATLRVLARALEVTASDVRADQILPLRRLRDPGLRALWGGLASSARADLRRHGVLGLAELETPPRITPMLLARIKDPTEQALILGEAIASDLLPTSEVPAMLRLQGLDPLVEIALRGRIEKPAPQDIERLKTLALEAGQAQRVLAAMVLARHGHAELMGPAVEAFAAQPEPARGAKAGTLLLVIRREKMPGGSAFFEKLASIYAEDRTLSADILRAWLHADPSSARPALAKAVAAATSPTDTARLALAALDAAERLEPSDFDLFPRDDPSGLFAQVVKAGRAIAARAPDEPLLALARDRARTEIQLWCVERSKGWERERATALCRAIVESWSNRGGVHVAVGSAAGSAAEQLAALGDWDWLSERLSEGCAAGDEKLVTALLSGLLGGPAIPDRSLASDTPWPDAATSAAAALLWARRPEIAGDKSKVVRLREIALGVDGRLPVPLRVQAAWLAARASGDADATIARLLAGVN